MQTRSGPRSPLVMALRALSLGVLVVAISIAAVHKGLVQPPPQLQEWLQQQPALAAALDRLRSVPAFQSILPPAADPGCSCGVSKS